MEVLPKNFGVITFRFSVSALGVIFFIIVSY